MRSIPAGVYRFTDVMDDDGMGTRDIPIELRITMRKGDRIVFDFSGTAKQVTGNINVTLNATQAAVCYTLKALLDPDVPNNQGMLDLPEIMAAPARSSMPPSLRLSRRAPTPASASST